MRPTRLYPKINISKIIQHANNIITICQRDKVELTTAGLPWERVNMLAELLPQLSDIHAHYILEREENRIATKTLNTFINDCKRLRGSLAKELRDAFRNAGEKVRIPAVSKRKTHNDLIQDLNDLSVVASHHRKLLECVNFDMSLAKKAAHVSHELLQRVADITLDRQETANSVQPQRMALYETVCSSVAVICRYGRKAFADNPPRLQLYRSIK